jgi:hypothetical protein
MFVAIEGHAGKVLVRAATFALFALSSSAAAQGTDQLWEVTMQMQMPGMPTAMPAQVRQVCVAQNHRDEDLIPRQGNCRVLDSRRAGNKLTYTMACTGEQAMNVAGEMTFAADRYDGRMQMTMGEGGQSMAMTQTYAGRRVGACTASK